eukprot:tig00020902_g14997.t1
MAFASTFFGVPRSSASTALLVQAPLARPARHTSSSSKGASADRFFVAASTSDKKEQCILNTDDLPQSFTLEVKPGETHFVCRCWKSKTFPLCDGAHKAMNDAGDKVAPAVIKGAPADQ